MQDNIYYVASFCTLLGWKHNNGLKIMGGSSSQEETDYDNCSSFEQIAYTTALKISGIKDLCEKVVMNACSCKFAAMYGQA
jgi:hypothetical protein